MVNFEGFWSKSTVLGRIGRSGKVLGFISSNFGTNPTAGRPPKGNNPGAIIIIIIPDLLTLRACCLEVLGRLLEHFWNIFGQEFGTLGHFSQHLGMF